MAFDGDEPVETEFKKMPYRSNEISAITQRVLTERFIKDLLCECDMCKLRKEIAKNYDES